MKVFLKYVLKSMTEKKGRFFLLVVAISLSTALVVASMGLIGIIIDGIAGPQLEAYENKEIVINSTDKSSYFFSDEGINSSGIDEDSLMKELYIDGKLVDKVDTDEETMLRVAIRGRDIQYVNEEIITQGNLEEFDGATCIISERTAKERNLAIGDTIEVIIAGMTKNLKITAISGIAGVFYNDTSKAFVVVVPYEYLSKDLGQEGNYNLILANSNNKTIQEGIDQFNENNTTFSAEELFDEEMVEEQVAGFMPILMIMLIVVIVMSSIIIYSSFKLIITERLTTIGTFLSQGASVGKVKMILYLEGLAYGFWGAVFGNILGIIGLHITNRLVSPLKDYGIYSKVIIEPLHLLYGAIFAVVLSILSAYLPVRRISKLQVKDIILNDVRITKSIGWKKFIIGIILILVSIGVYQVVKEDLGVSSGLLIVTSLTGVIFAYPKLIDILSKVLFRFLRGKSRSVIYAINNLRTSKILLGNITLIIISLSSIVVITSLGASMINVVTEAYTKLEFDIEISNLSTIRENEEESTADYLVKELKKLEIKEEEMDLVNYDFGQLHNPSKDLEIGLAIMGVNMDTYVRYNQYLELDKEEYSQYLKEFEKDDVGVIITSALSKQIKKVVGDSVEVTCNGMKKSLTISGIIDGKLLNNGYFLLIKSTTLQSMYGISSADTISFSTDGDLEEVLRELKPILREIGATAITRDEMLKRNLKQNEVIVNALSVFSYMAIVIAALGIVNNVSISFLQRKSEFAVLASVGMQNSGRAKIIFFESIASVTWAMIITSIYCIFELKLVSILIKKIGFEMDISLDYNSLPLLYVVTLVIVLMATIPVFIKSRKLSIIHELKYE